MKDPLRKGRQGEFSSGFKSENGSQLEPSQAESKENKALNVQVLYKGYGIPKIIFSMVVVVVITHIFKLYNSGGYSYHIFSSLIFYLALLALILYNRTAVTFTPEKTIIRRHLFKSLVLRKEDISQISISKNKGHSYRWPLRLLALATLTITLPQTIERITRDLYMETTPLLYKLTGVLVNLWPVAFVLVIYFYIFESTEPYQKILKITTRSNLNLELYIDEPEEIMTIIKKENE